MSIVFIILLGIGLGMDCFAVSVTAGMAVNKPVFSQRLRMAVIFGLFQAIMPLFGFLAGKGFAEEIQRVDHWLAFAILLFIGGKMIYEDLKSPQEGEKEAKDMFQWYALLSLAVATSIDALATGLIFVSLPNMIWQAISIIGLCSFFLSLSGSYLGTYCSEKIRFRAELWGGIILILIGTKILIEHLFLLT
ncbi:MAG: manganese efflux pump MntP family protein [Syntrophobacterales bacterium]|jgi:putative Mn2+ efflux pump MntP|nr:manganese efflux pump MntP family protein [Syntrophobacterales bacterium]